MRISSLYRYPVKGLTPEKLDATTLTPGACLPWDRAFALAQGDAAFNPHAPSWLPKTNFMCLLRNAGIAAIRARFDDEAELLSLTAPDGATLIASPLTPEGQVSISDFLIATLGDETRLGANGKRPHFTHAAGHSFCDHRTQVISLIGLGSLHALEQAVAAPRDERRFRANIYIGDIEPWTEFNWIGRTIAIGETRLIVQERIDRCGATTVNPDTALRDANPIKELMQNFGHVDLGIFAEVTHGGEIHNGEEIRIL